MIHLRVVGDELRQYAGYQTVCPGGSGCLLCTMLHQVNTDTNRRMLEGLYMLCTGGIFHTINEVPIITTRKSP